MFPQSYKCEESGAETMTSSGGRLCLSRWASNRADLPAAIDGRDDDNQFHSSSLVAASEEGSASLNLKETCRLIQLA